MNTHKLKQISIIAIGAALALGAAAGTFTALLTPLSPLGPVTTDAGTWQLTPPNVVQVFDNPQGHLTLTDARGVVLFSNDILL